MTLVSPVFVWKFGATSLLDKYSLAELIGLRTTGIILFSYVIISEYLYILGLIQASLLPLLLTMILFLGPTAMLLLDVSSKHYILTFNRL